MHSTGKNRRLQHTEAKANATDGRSSRAQPRRGRGERRQLPPPSPCRPSGGGSLIPPPPHLPRRPSARARSGRIRALGGGEAWRRRGGAVAAAQCGGGVVTQRPPPPPPPLVLRRRLLWSSAASSSSGPGRPPPPEHAGRPCPAPASPVAAVGEGEEREREEDKDRGRWRRRTRRATPRGSASSPSGKELPLQGIRRICAPPVKLRGSLDWAAMASGGGSGAQEGNDLKEDDEPPPPGIRRRGTLPRARGAPALPSLPRRHLLHCHRRELKARAEVVGQPRELHARAAGRAPRSPLAGAGEPGGRRSCPWPASAPELARRRARARSWPRRNV
ncbi:hypothetical protein PVAP13_9KG019720 [Panicum virgatum]|uniref:Uncharacterized protein n=1 Tax=Panicum virgatum TaxID=38727 RepID=A0A8T0N7V4_PANVG|nr:hypothetical protein PVAP13_9KG019720 [Panicum virgatum]